MYTSPDLHCSILYIPNAKGPPVNDPLPRIYGRHLLPHLHLQWNVKQNISFKNTFYPAFSGRLLAFNTVSTPPNLAAQPLVQYCVYCVYLNSRIIA